MKLLGLLLVIVVCCGYTMAAPATLVRKRRVSGSEDGESSEDNLFDYKYEEGDERLYEDYEEYQYGETFLCSDEGEEVAVELMCDGFIDCADGSDEIVANCEEHGITPTTTTSPSPTVPATTKTVATVTSKVVQPLIREIKSYEYDYVDACIGEEFQCTSDISICLLKSQVCDGVNDCPHKEDEAACGGFRPSVALEDKEWFDVGTSHLKRSRQTDQDFTDFRHTLDRIKRPRERTNSSPTQETESKAQKNFRPIIEFKEPPPERANHPIFVPVAAENDEKKLGLESDYQYIILDSDGNVQNKQHAKQEASTAKISENGFAAAADDFRLSSPEEDHEIEINHATGEITLIKNGVRTLLSPLKGNPRPALKPQREENIGSTFRLTGISEREGVAKIDGRVKKHKTKLRGIVGQLLHHIGKMVEEEDDLIPADLNIAVGLNQNFAENNLYSRILSCSPRTHIKLNIDFHL